MSALISYLDSVFWPVWLLIGVGVFVGVIEPVHQGIAKRRRHRRASMKNLSWLDEPKRPLGSQR